MFDWVKKIDNVVEALDERPQFREVHSFPLEPIQKKLRQLFQDESLTLSSKGRGWVTREELLKEQFSSQISFSLFLPPLTQPLFLSLDKAALLSFIGVPLTEEVIIQGYIRYLLAEVMHVIHSSKRWGALGFQIKESLTDLSSHLKEEAYFKVDVIADGRAGSLWNKLYLSDSFRQSWNHYCINELPSSKEELAQDIRVELGVQVGQTTLPYKELITLKEGDFLLLDSCWYDLEKKRGSVLLTLNAKPLFRGKVKGAVLELAPYPPYEEVSEMDKDEDEFEEEEEFYDEAEEEEVEDFSEGDEGAESLEEESAQETHAAGASVPLSLDEIDVTVVIEVCRLRMSIKEASALSSGSVLQLDVPIERGVNLVINGKSVGKAELMRIGDNLGVRILELASKE